MFYDVLLKGGIAVTGSIITYLFGGWDALLQFLILAMVADYASGMYLAAKKKELSSKIGFAGIVRKVMILVIVALAHGLDTVLIDQELAFLGIEMPVLRTVVIWAYIINELVSVLENTRDAGVYVPKFLDKLIQRLKNDTEEKANGLLNINVRASKAVVEEVEEKQAKKEDNEKKL